MILAYNQQVQSVLSQGVLTRQMTRAQSAGQQIEQMSIDYQQQLDQINEQISAAQYRVAAETQIFGLAQTRIGLENQLLVAQNTQTNLDMQSISALQALVNQISTGTFSQGSLGALLNSFQTVSNPAAGASASTILAILTAIFGGGSGSSSLPISVPTGAGTAVFETLAAASYQNRAQMGFGSYKGQNL